MQLIRTSTINPVNDKNIEVIDDAGIVTQGKIILDYGIFSDLKVKYPTAKILDFSHLVFTPGFIDLHTHIPQYPAIGLGKGELLPWLQNHIFPLEQKFVDYDYALSLSEVFFNKAISLGTTTLSAYSSIHKSGTIAAIDAGLKSGINLYIGKVMMDMGDSDYKHSLDKNISETYDVIDYINKLDCEQLHYVVTPRYAGSCSIDLLKESANIAKENNLLIQTHLSENTDELNYIASIHPEYKSYTEIYQSSGILGTNSLLAHCIYLSDTELSILKESGSNIVHCPSSNRYLMSGRMNFEKYSSMGLRIGLGTDVAAGYNLSLINEMRESIETSGDLKLFSDSNNLLPTERIFYSATLGAAEILKNSDIGIIAKGRRADLVGHAVYDKSDLKSALNQIIYGNSTIEKVIVGGEIKFSL